MRFFETPSRMALMECLNEALSDIGDPEFACAAKSSLAKLGEIGDSEFSALVIHSECLIFCHEAEPQAETSTKPQIHPARPSGGIGGKTCKPGNPTRLQSMALQANDGAQA
jgi:hypothetical protein